MGKPRKLPDSQGDSFCPWQIIGIGDERVRYAAGIDGVQALDLAMKVIGAYLGARNVRGKWIDDL